MGSLLIALFLSAACKTGDQCDINEHDTTLDAKKVTVVGGSGVGTGANVASVDAGTAVTCAGTTTALVPAGAVGRMVTLTNVGAAEVALGPSGAAATTGQRILPGGTVTIGPLAAAFALDCIRVGGTSSDVNRQVWSP